MLIISKSPHVHALFLMAAACYFMPVLASQEFIAFETKDELQIAVNEYCNEDTFFNQTTYGWVVSLPTISRMLKKYRNEALIDILDGFSYSNDQQQFVHLFHS